MQRRDFLSAIGLGATAALVEACNSSGPASARSLLEFASRKNETLERWLLRPSSRDRLAAGTPLSGDAFPKYFVSDEVPRWDPAVRGVWSLEVTGAVKRSVRLTLEDLRGLRTTTQRVHHYCVEGWTAYAEWTGVRFSDLARVVEPLPDAGYVDFQSFDSGYHESWDIESAMHPQTLIAYAMDGRYLGAGHGAPARVHSPVKLGYKNTKYLTRVVFMPARNGGYWTDRGYEWYGGV
ncbi:MAG: molybdopterin-dependent oxidoreductase [Gemmatimonadaceae bacterium]